MKRVLMVLVLVASAGCSVHVVRPVTPESARAIAQGLLDHGAQAWNRGDLDEFMSDYTEVASFVTQRSVRHGRAAIRAGYAARFEPGAVRDSLSFQDLEVDVISEDAINAIAYYVLMRGDSVTARGPTSLVLRKVKDRWQIAHDHSS